MDVLASYILLCMIFGTTFIAIKVGILAGLPPILFAGLRFTLAGSMALGLGKASRLRLKLSPAEARGVLLVGLTNTAIMFGTLFWAERFLSPGTAATVGATLPMFILFLRTGGIRRMSAAQVAGILAGLLGVGLVLSPALSAPGGQLNLLAVGVLLASELAAGWGSVHAGRTMALGLPALVLNGYQMLLGGIALLFLSPLAGTLNLSNIPVQGWAALAYLVVVGSLVGWSLFYHLISKTGPVFPATWTYIAPVISTLLGIAFLHEPLLAASLVGVALVLTGAALADFPTWKSTIERVRRRGEHSQTLEG